MKLIIDIPDNTYTNIQEHKRHTGFTILDLIKAIRHGTPIPDNEPLCENCPHVKVCGDLTRAWCKKERAKERNK